MNTLLQRSLVRLGLTAIPASVGVGCNPAQGFGKDMETAGDKIQLGAK